MSSNLHALLIDPKQPFIHRDLSWIQFNNRVLDEANDKRNPTLERLKFLGITASNLDEFFMIRFASLRRERQNLERYIKQGQKPKKNKKRLKRIKKIRTEILKTIRTFSGTQSKVLDELIDDLKKANIRLHRNFSAGSETELLAKKLFNKHVREHISEEFGASFSNIRSLGNLAISICQPDETIRSVDRAAPQVIWQKDKEGTIHAFLLDDLLLHFFANEETRAEPLLIRITRDADVSVDLDEEDPESIPDVVRRRIRERDIGRALRLQFRGTKNTELLGRVIDAFRLSIEQVYNPSHSLALHGLFKFSNETYSLKHHDQDLFYSPLSKNIPKGLAKTDSIFENLQNRDYFIHHPYDSFDSYVNFIQAAVKDPDIRSIQQTVYRVDALSKVTELLKEAAAEKRVRVFIEPRARFDEINNIQLAEELRAAGVKVVFASGNLKMHAKVALVTRRENNRTVSYAHLSTGNYNATTARQYEDMAIVTGKADICSDVKNFFDATARDEIPKELNHLVLAPRGLHRKMLSLIRDETKAAKNGLPARIFAKVNALVDEKIISSLYEASCAGVKVDLVVRGACSLIPGISELSENIRVYSIVDRFLEHSRVYYFQNSNQIFLSSADWMPRNFFSRLEIAFPVLDQRIFEHISSVIIPTYLDDRVKARSLTKNGIWRMRPGHSKEKATRAQFSFIKLSKINYKGTPLDIGPKASSLENH